MRGGCNNRLGRQPKAPCSVASRRSKRERLKHFRRWLRTSQVRTALASFAAPRNHEMLVFTSSFYNDSASLAARSYLSRATSPTVLVLCCVISCVVVPARPAVAQGAAEAAQSDVAASTPDSSAVETSAPDDLRGQVLTPGKDMLDDPEELKKAIGNLPEDVREDGQAAWDRFRETGETLASAMLALRSDQLRYRNGLDQTSDAAARFREQRKRTWELMQQQFTNALALIRYVPSVEAARYLMTMVQHHLVHDIYDAETYEAATRMLDLGHSFRFLYLAAARSAVVAGQFEAAKNIYDTLEGEELQEVDLRLKHQLDSLEVQYDQEQAAIKRADPDALPHIRLETTQGDVLIELFPDAAPSAVAHFRKLVKEGFYDGLDFSVVTHNLLAMTGDATGDGRGNTGEFLIDEHGREESRPGMRGSVVMAKMSVGEGKFIENSSSSQIAILFLPIPAVSGTQSVIGRVIDGMDVVSNLRRIDPSKKKEQIQLPPDAVLRMEIVRFGAELPEPKYVDLQAEIDKAVESGLLKPKTPDVPQQ